MITIPTIAELYNAIKSDLETEFGATIPVVGKSFLRIFAACQAAKLKLYYLTIGKLQKNIFVDTADPEVLGGTLERFGRVKLGRNPFPAQAAQYKVGVTGSIGAVIKASTTFKSDDDSLSPGYLFILDSQFTLSATDDFIVIRALTPGTISKLNLLDKLTATAPIALVDSSCYVDSEVVPPLAAEDIEAYRQATINAERLEPKGGAATDFRLWSQDAQGVKQVYPYAKSGVFGEINLFVEANLVDSTDGRGTPSSALLTNVKSVIEFDPDTTLPTNERGRQPMGIHQVNYLPIGIKIIDIKVIGLLDYTPTIGTLLTSAITDSVNTIRPFIAAADVLDERNDILDKNKMIGVIVTQKPGAVFTDVEIKIDGIVNSSYQFDNGSIPYVNSVTYA
ncbi:MAG: baseplate J/gp47 family protein [Chitinophagales bacterium]